MFDETPTDEMQRLDPVGTMVLGHDMRKAHVKMHDEPFELLPEGDPYLTSEAEPFDFAKPPFDPIDFTVRMAETMLRHRGIGLAAPQIGVLTQMFVLRANPIIAVFNPKIVDVSGEPKLGTEGCLSFPGLAVKVKRATRIRVRYQQPNSEIVTCEFAGLTARAFQHEFDHLYGVLFTRRASLYHRHQAYRKRSKI